MDLPETGNVDPVTNAVDIQPTVLRRRREKADDQGRTAPASEPPELERQLQCLDHHQNDMRLVQSIDGATPATSPARLLGRWWLRDLCAPAFLAGVHIMPAFHLAALPLFMRRLSSRSILTGDEEVALMALKGQVKQVERRIDIVLQGETVDHSCLVVEGLIGRFGQSSDGSRQITCLYIPGDMADLPSVVSPKSGWGLMSLTKTTILRLPHIDLRRLAASYPGIAEAFWRDCVADGSIFSEWVVNVGSRDGPARIAHLICEMAIRYEQSGQSSRQSFSLPITQSDLGDATGLTNVHVNRVLKGLKNQSIVTLQSGHITIPSWEKIVSAGDFDDSFMLLDGPSPRISLTENNRAL